MNCYNEIRERNIVIIYFDIGKLMKEVGKEYNERTLRRTR